MFCGYTCKFKSKKHCKRENKAKARKRKARCREEENFSLNISKLLFDGEIPVKEVNETSGANYPNL